MGIDKKPIGVIGLTNNHTLIVEELVHGIDEYVVSYISNGDTKQRKTSFKGQSELQLRYVGRSFAEASRKGGCALIQGDRRIH